MPRTHTALGLQVPVVEGGEVVQVKHDPISSRGMAPLVDAVKTLLSLRLKLEIDVARHQSEGAVNRYAASGLEKLTQTPDIEKREGIWFVDPEGVLPSFQPIEVDASRWFRGEPLQSGGFLGQEEGPGDMRKPRMVPPQRRADLPGLVRDDVGLALNLGRVAADSLGGPVLHFENAHARRPDRDDIDLVGLESVRHREGEIGQQDPLVFSWFRQETLPQEFDRLSFALVCLRAALDDLHPHVDAPN